MSRRSLAALAGVLGGVLLCMPIAAMAECKLGALELPVNLVEGRAIATVGINGTPVPLMVDTGAFFSMLSDAAAAQLALPVHFAPFGLQVRGLTGAVDARMAKASRLQLMGGEVPNVEFLIGGNEAGGGAMGLMGRNVLSFADTEYDLAHGMIRFMFPKGDCGGSALAYWAGDEPVAQVELEVDPRDRRPALTAMAHLNGEEIRVLFDTGATSTVSLRAARRAGVTEADLRPRGKLHGAGRGEARLWSASFQKFELGGETIANDKLLVAEMDLDHEDMLLGIDFFLSHRIYVSRSQRRMFFTYNGGQVFSLNTAWAAASAPVRAADVDPLADAAAYARRGAASAARRDFVPALADLDRACEMEPQVPGHFMQRGRVHVALRQLPEALQDFDTAVRLDPAQSDARFERAALRTGPADRAGAIDDLALLDRTLPPQSHLRLGMARLYGRFGMPERELPELEQWISVHRNEAGLEVALNQRCWARTLVGVDFDKALDDCDEALDRQPKNANFLDSRGWLHLRRNESKAALADFEQSLGIQPNRAWALYGRGLARQRLGDVEAGRADLVAARGLMSTIDDAVGRHGLANPTDRSH